MRTLIALNGHVDNLKACALIAASCDRLICADGGARHMIAMDLVPELLVGDLDSIDSDSLAWMERHLVRILRYPAEKDWTDSELAVKIATDTMVSGDEVWLIGAFGTRLDHVLANLGMASLLAGKGIRTWLTDGTTFIAYVKGPETLRIDLNSLGLSNALVSVIPSAGTAMCGVTLEGMAYPLDDAVLETGSTRGVSNHAAEGIANISVRIDGGEGYVTLTPPD